MNYLKIIGNHIIKLEEVNSTNDYAIKLLSKNAPIEGTIITTSFQTNGKGQYGRQWQADRNMSILLSLILKPKSLSVHNIFLLNMCIALSIRGLISRHCDLPVKIKWPNDIYVNDRKIAGILIQNQLNSKGINHSIIGIGININQSNFIIKNGRPISLHQITNLSYDLEQISTELYDILDQYYLQLRTQKYKLIKQAYLQCLYKINTTSTFKLSSGEQVEGTIRNITEEGKILIEINQELKAFMMHEINMILSDIDLV